MLELTKAGSSDTLVLTGISRRAFDSDITVGASFKGGPPGYMSVKFHTKMANANHLFKLSLDGLLIGGAILFVDGTKMDIGRIFVAPEHFRKGYGLLMMQKIEELFSEVKEIYLDTPIWNIRTNTFYQKLGYTEYKRDHEFVYYMKK